jgi:hypothetical protein
MKVKINLDKDDIDYDEEYDGREGTVSAIYECDNSYHEGEFCIDVNVEMLNGKVDKDVVFRPNELERVY